MQLEAYRGVVAESEAKRARAEEELVTTAKLAAALEARLAAAHAQIDSLQLGVQVRRRPGGVVASRVVQPVPCTKAEIGRGV